VSDDDVFLTSKQVRRRYGNMGRATLQRRIGDAASGFPKPIVMAERNYWRLADLLAYEKRCASKAKVNQNSSKDDSSENSPSTSHEKGASVSEQNSERRPASGNADLRHQHKGRDFMHPRRYREPRSP
jgi:hypothetical protein